MALMKRTFQFPRWVKWGLALPLIALNGWVVLQIFSFFQSLISVVITAILLAFILEYPVGFLQRFRLSQTRAVLLVLGLTLFTSVILGITLLPTLIEQLNQLVTRLPKWIASGTQQLQLLQSWAQSRQLPIDLSKLIAQLEERSTAQLQAVSGDILRFLVDAIGRILDLVVTLVLTFYLLLHGDRLWEGLFQWFPRDLSGQIRQSLRQNFHNYFVGQATVALILGTSMTIAFLVLQVPFGLLFGMTIGGMALFPFGASLGIGIVSVLLLLQNVWLGAKALAVAVIIQQIIENGVAPQLIGGFTGLNPAWILVSLLLGAKLAGVLGVVVAVPVASFTKSMADYFKEKPLAEKRLKAERRSAIAAPLETVEDEPVKDQTIEDSEEP
jgi:predicted PurR-regulated permease PerM